MRTAGMLDQVLPFRFEHKSLSEIRTRIKVQERKSDLSLKLDASWEKYRCLDEAELRDSLRVELARREQVQRRAQTLLGSIAVMTAFTIGASGALRLPANLLPCWILAFAVLLTLPYLAAAAWFALRTVRPGELFDVFLQSRVHEGKPVRDSVWKDQLIWLIQMNQAQNLILGVFAERSYRCIRNGIIGLVAVFLLLLADGILRGADQAAPGRKASRYSTSSPGYSNHETPAIGQPS